MGHRWLSSPRAISGALICTAVPPEAGTRNIPPFLASGVNRITPSVFQAPPLPDGASQIVCTGPPATSNFFNFPSAKKASDLPSADQNGYAAPSVPGNFRAPRLPISCTHTTCFAVLSWLTTSAKFGARSRQHDVYRLQVPVHNSRAMRFVQRIRDLRSILQYLLQRQRPFLQPFRQRLPFHALHHQIVHAIL